MKRQVGRVVIALIILVFIGIIISVYQVYRYVYMPNIIINEPVAYLYIPTGSTFEDVCKTLVNNNLVKNISTFEWLAERKNYPQHVKAGRYKLKNGMNNNELIEILRLGKQEPVRYTINNIRTIPQLASYTSRNLEIDSAEFVNLLTNNSFLEKYNINSYTSLSIFLPNTYFIFWNTSANALIERMYAEFNKFWTTDRIEKANKLGLNPIEVIILASIVEEETNFSQEYPIIAGVYINRLKRKMPLQADPTIKYALGDFQMKRILKKHLQVNSPYNTYKHNGLPPGPIVTPSLQAIEGVLNFTSHSYLYFCAKDDFSGRHVFARTLSEHSANAMKFQKALNRLKIYK